MNQLSSMSTEEKEKIIAAVRQEAKNCEMEVGGCARCTLFALQKYLKLCDDDKVEPILRAASTLSGGVAGSGEVCGALTGGIMAIGLAYGSGNMSPEADETSRARNMVANDRAYELLCRFRNEFGSIFCRDIRTKLLGRPWQLRNVAYHQWASRKEVHDKCGEVTDKGAQLAAEVIFTPMDDIPRFLSKP